MTEGVQPHVRLQKVTEILASSPKILMTPLS